MNIMLTFYQLVNLEKYLRTYPSCVDATICALSVLFHSREVILPQYNTFSELNPFHTLPLPYPAYPTLFRTRKISWFQVHRRWDHISQQRATDQRSGVTRTECQRLPWCITRCCCVVPFKYHVSNLLQWVFQRIQLSSTVESRSTIFWFTHNYSRNWPRTSSSLHFTTSKRLSSRRFTGNSFLSQPVLFPAYAIAKW